MKRAKTAVDKTIGWVLVVLMAASVLNVLWQVFTRFVLGEPSSFTEELARYLLIWIGVLGAAYAVGQRAHLALDLLPEKLTGQRRKTLEHVIQACVVLFSFFVMVLGGARLVYVQLRLGQTSPSLELPLGWVYMVLPLSGLLMIFYAIDRVTEKREAYEEAASDGRPLPGDDVVAADRRTRREASSAAAETNQPLTDL